MEVADVEVYLKFTEVEERKTAPKFLGIKTVIITPVHIVFDHLGTKKNLPLFIQNYFVISYLVSKMNEL